MRTSDIPVPNTHVQKKHINKKAGIWFSGTNIPLSIQVLPAHQNSRCVSRNDKYVFIVDILVSLLFVLVHEFDITIFITEMQTVVGRLIWLNIICKAKIKNVVY